MNSRYTRLAVVYCFFVTAVFVINYAQNTNDGDLIRVVWASIAPLALWALGGRPGPSPPSR